MLRLRQFLCDMQFSQNEDFDKYPRDNEADVAQLTAARVDAVFEPRSLYIRTGSRHITSGGRALHSQSTCQGTELLKG